MIAFKVDYTIQDYSRGRSTFRMGSGPVPDKDGKVTAEALVAFIKQTLIEEAKKEIQTQVSRGFDSGYATIVDGSRSKKIEDVSPFGKIEFASRADLGVVLMKIYEGLRLRAPIDTGLYLDSNLVFQNGRYVAGNLSELQTWVNSNPTIKDSDIIRFINVMPYARKLERYGITQQKGRARARVSKDKKRRSGWMDGKGRQVVLAENGAYFLTYRSIKRLFGRNADIRFELVPGGVIPGLKQFIPATNRAGKPLRLTYAAKKGRAYLYPSIAVRLVRGGVF